MSEVPSAENARRPSLTSGILSGFNAFLTALHASDPDMPTNLQTLRSDSGILIQLGAAADPQSVGVIPWRVAFYVLGDEAQVLNAIHLIDEYISWRAKHPSEGDLPLPSPIRLHVEVPDSLVKQVSGFQFQNPAEVTTPPSLSPFGLTTYRAAGAGLLRRVQPTWRFAQRRVHGRHMALPRSV